MTTALVLIPNRQFDEALQINYSHPNECNLFSLLEKAIKGGAPPATIRYLLDIESLQYSTGERVSLMMLQSYADMLPPLFTAIDVGCSSEVILALVERYPEATHIPISKEEPLLTPLHYLWFSEECRYLRAHGYKRAGNNQDQEDLCTKLWILFQAFTQEPEKLQRASIQDPSISFLDLDCVRGFAAPLPPDLLITLIEFLPLSVISRKDENGWTVLHYHVRYGQPFEEEGYQRHLVEMDMDDALMEDYTPLIDEDGYDFSGGSTFIEYNLKEEEDNNCYMEIETPSPCHIPRYEQYSVVRALLQKFPEATRMLNDEGHTPLQIARSLYEQYSVVMALLQKFPEETRMLNDEGRTPLRIDRSLDCLQALFEVENRSSSPSLLGM
jgi:hypothetical protein